MWDLDEGVQTGQRLLSADDPPVGSYRTHAYLDFVHIAAYSYSARCDLGLSGAVCPLQLDGSPCDAGHQAIAFPTVVFR